MEAIILAGGKGTRLRSIIGESPKPMALINGVPFLTKLFGWLESEGVRHVILSVGYQKQVITNYYGKQYKSIVITYAEEESALGTGGAIKHAASFCKTSAFFVVNGDTYCPTNLSSIRQDSIDTDFTMSVCFQGNADRYGLVNFDANNFKITSFKEKTENSAGYINAGIYLVTKHFCEGLPNTPFSLESFLNQNCSSLWLKAQPVTTDLFIDIGIPEDYDKAQQLID